MAMSRLWARREKYVEAQLAKRLGRAKEAADAAPLDAQQRAEQELYGVPENLKASALGQGMAAPAAKSPTFCPSVLQPHD